MLYCRFEKAPDGSPVGLQASTEDITGGEFSKGFSADVMHRRERSLVLVSEVLPTRKKAFVEMTHLPVPVEVLEAIATDPRVGPRTTPELNRAGKRAFPKVFDERP